MGELNKRTLYYLFTMPGLLLYVVLFLGPVYMAVYYSLTDYDGLNPKFAFIGLRNYQEAFHDVRFAGDIGFTVHYTVILTVMVTLISLLLALALNSSLVRFRNVYRSIYFFPAVLGSIVVGLIWNQIYYGAVPVIGKALGIEALSTNILGNNSLVIYGVLFVNIWQGISIPMVLFFAGLQSIPKHLYEAATLEGATALQKFRFISFPFLTGIVGIVLILNIKAGLTTFDYILALTGGGPGFKTESIGLLIYKQGFANIRFAYGAAQSVLLLLVIAIISVAQFKYLNRKGVDQQ